MNLAELQSALHDLGADIPQNTLKRWGYDGLIRRPQRYKKGRGGGKGRAVSWSWDAVAEAAAIWAIKNAGILKAPPSKKMIDAIKLTGTPFTVGRLLDTRPLRPERRLRQNLLG